MEKIGGRAKPGAMLMRKAASLVLLEPAPFSTKRRPNFRALSIILGLSIAVFIVVVLLLPPPQPQNRDFHVRASSSESETGAEANRIDIPTSSAVMPGAVPEATTFRGRLPGEKTARASNRGGAMIIPRDNDSSTTLPPGTIFTIKLSRHVSVMQQAIPVIGIVDTTVAGPTGFAISEGSQIFGTATLDPETERARIDWTSIRFADGRMKSFSAVALGSDGQIGIEGDYHSDALKNTAGQLIARFASGMAQGAITRTPFGASEGGIQNGVLQGAADTAKDRADSWTEDMKKPRAWIELQEGTRIEVILSQPFVFRDPGTIN